MHASKLQPPTTDETAQDTTDESTTDLAVRRIFESQATNEIERLRAANAALRKQIADAQAQRNREPAPLRFQVSPKGAVSVYGLGRYPVTLYSNQWQRLLAEASRILDFMTTNALDLATLDRRPGK